MVEAVEMVSANIFHDCVSLAEGAKVSISSRKKDNVDETVATLKKEGLDVFGIPCHVGKDSDRTNLIEETLKQSGGKIDILVSNAAVNPGYGPLLETTKDQFDKVFDINVRAAFLLTKEVIPIMKKNGGGSIVFVSSIGGYSAFENLGAYSISKTALFGLSKVVANEHAKDNIRCNAVAPGVIKTSFSQALWADPKNEKLIKSMVPLGRLGESDDIAGAVAFLSSDDARYMTGESLVVAGGMTPPRL
mmetsp:Transcript_36074/g.94868  ORF Transcript_36074/g.94868 Transcript_36074/m.94868 type:complete len:247 (+) Transcript_36074:152-892(+)